jgi:hypothetical protein
MMLSSALHERNVSDRRRQPCQGFFSLTNIHLRGCHSIFPALPLIEWRYIAAYPSIRVLGGGSCFDREKLHAVVAV